MKEIKHVFFDLDDTLWDFEKNSGLVLEQLFEEFALAPKLNTDVHSFLKAYKEKNLALWKLYYQKAIDKQFLRNHRFNETFKLFGYDNYDENLRVTEAYLERSPKGTHLKPGCREVLDYLQPKYKLHIITNGFREVQSIKMDGSGIRHYFTNIIISEEYQLTKPDVQIFRLAESLAGATPEQCLMIGDNFDSDITGAHNANWQSIYFNEHKPEGYTGIHISGLAELQQLL